VQDASGAHGIPVLPGALIHRDEAKTSLSQVRERIPRLGTGTVSAVRQACKHLEFLWLMTISLLMQRWSKLSDDSQAIVEPCEGYLGS